jgi:hypothetical protein
MNDSLFEKIRPDFEEALRDAPIFGSVKFIVHIVEGEPVRIESGQTESRKLPQKQDRG